MREGFVPGVEQPRCVNCSHRRIYHTLGILDGPRGSYVEYGRPCSLTGCGCRVYQPSNVRVISGG